MKNIGNDVMLDYFHKILPDIYREGGRSYAPRAEQIAYARLVSETFDAAHAEQQKDNGACAVLPVGAETGTGKSLAFLIPELDRVAQDRLAGLGHRAAVATFTTQLRDQLMQKDLPTAIAAVKRYRGVSLKAASYYGSGSYLSLSTLKERIADNEKASAKDRKMAESLMEQMIADPAFALIDDARIFFDLEDDQPIFECLADRDLGCTWKEAKGVQAYIDMRENIQSADVLLISHAAMLYNVKGWFSMLDGDDETQWIRYVVFDEAHRLPDAAESMMRSTKSVFGMAQTLLEGNTAFGPVDGVPESVKALNACATLLQDAFPEGKADKNSHNLVNLGLSDMIPALGRTVRTVLMQQMDWAGLKQVAHVLFKAGDKQVHAAQKKLKQAAAQVNIGLDASGSENAIHDHIDLLVELDGIMRYLSDFLEVMDPESRNIYQLVGSLSWSPDKHYPSLELITLNPGRLVARYWRHYPSKAKPEDVKPSRLYGAVLTSATMPNLPDVGIFNPVEEAEIKEGWQVPPKLMIPSISDIPMFAPERFGDLEFVLSGPSEPVMVSDPVEGRYVNPEWEKSHLFPMMEHMMRMALREFNASKGKDDVRGVMVLTPSGLDIPGIIHYLESETAGTEKVVWIDQTGRHLKTAVKEFESTLRKGEAMPVLLTAGGWEGVDLPGQIGHLFIARLPFPPVDQVRKDAMLQKYAPDYVNRIQGLMRAHTVRSKLCQGIGRLVRQVNDHGVIWLGDVRFGAAEELIAVSKMHRVKGFLKHRTPDALLRAVPNRFHGRLEEAAFFDAQRGMYTLDDLLQSVA